MATMCARLWVLLAVLIAASSVAASEIVLTELQTKGTFENAGVRVTYTGDADSNAVISVEYRRKGETEWIVGHPMIRIAGSLCHQPVRAFRRDDV